MLSTLVSRRNQLWTALGFMMFFCYKHYSFIKLLHLPIKWCPNDSKVIACNSLPAFSLTFKGECQEMLLSCHLSSATLWLWSDCFLCVLLSLHCKHFSREMYSLRFHYPPPDHQKDWTVFECWLFWTEKNSFEIQI